MIFRQLTPEGDWTFGNGVSNYATGQQAIALNIQTSVLMWFGDCFFSLNGWVNWKLLLNVGQQKNLNSQLQTLLLQCYGVIQVISASVAYNAYTRQISATYTVNTVYSQQITNTLSVLTGEPNA